MSDIGVSIGQRFEADSVVILGINISENLDLVKNFITAFGITFPVLMDSDGFVVSDYNQFGGTSPFPLDYIIDQQGKIAYYDTEYNPRRMTEIITDLLHPVGVEKDESSTPAPLSYQLKQNYPNPFNPATTLEYTLLNPGEVVSLKIYNLLGQEVARLVSEVQQSGNHIVKWNASHLPSGIYFYRLQAGDYVQTRKMVLLK